LRKSSSTAGSGVYFFIKMAVSKEEEKKIKKIQKEAEERAAQREAEEFNLSYLNVSKVPINIEALKLLEEETAKEAEMAIIQKELKVIAAIARNPENPRAKEILENFKSGGYKVNVFFVSKSGLQKVLDFYKKLPKKLKEITGEVKISKEKLDQFKQAANNTDDLKKVVDEYSAEKTTELAEVLLGGALSLDASDIHIEPEKDKTKLRYRIDGMLQDITYLSTRAYNLFLSRIKILAELKLNVKDRAQDGRFSISSEGLEIEIRTSILPSEYGETIVMRVLNPKSLISIEELGMRKDLLTLMETEIRRPNGMILITGPTGSGKTTTLYAYLKKITSPEIKIITIEDPIEYHLEGISQTQVKPEKGYDFANGLRAIVRQDPDVILVGEIRDRETAEIACHASLTGHLVFSTLHTNDAIGAIPRLIDMGVQPSIIAPAINVTMAQRLVRRLCKKCKKAIEISNELKEKIESVLNNLPQNIRPSLPKTIFKGSGCPECNNTGFKGRIAVFEIFKIDPEIEKSVISYASTTELKELSQKKGLVLMQEDALLKILEGMTTIEEAERVLGKIL